MSGLLCYKRGVGLTPPLPGPLPLRRVMIGILEELAMSVEDLEENALNLGEEIDVLSDDLKAVRSRVREGKWQNFH